MSEQGRARSRHRRHNRAVIVLLAVGAGLGLVWQALSPLGSLTADPAGPLAPDVPSVAADGWFTALAGGGALIAGLIFVIRHVVAKPGQYLLATWVQWLSAGLLSCIAMVVTGSVAEWFTRLVTGPPEGEVAGDGVLHQLSMAWELSSLLPIVIWPGIFGVTTAVGSILATMFGDDDLGAERSADQYSASELSAGRADA